MEFEIFKTGIHTSDKGITKTYTEEDLNYIASNYNPQEHEAPIVVGHPVDNSPSFGWIESLKVQGDKLIAKAKDVIPEFIDAVKQGIYKKRSISLDKYGKLRHVGFLGGAAPAVKGLADIQFSSETSDIFESDFDLSSIEHQESSFEQPETVVKYPEHQEKLFTSFSSQLDNIQSLLTNLSQNFSEKDSGQLNVITNQINELKFKVSNSDFENKLNDKLADGSLTPAMKQKTMDLIEYLSTQNFSSEFDLSKYRDTVKSLLNEFIDSIPKIIYYENFADKPENDNITISKDDYSGLPLDEESAALHKKALSIMKKDNISYQAAILKITKRIN